MRNRILGFTAACALVGALGGNAGAATVTVDALAAAGGCSLEEAVSSINGQAGIGGCSGTGTFGVDDTIVFDGALSGTTQASAAMTLSRAVTITGPGASDVTVSAASGQRLFVVAPGVTAEITGLTLSGGTAPDGGAIRVGAPGNPATLTIEGCSFDSNSATGDGSSSAYGGAIASDGVLTVRDSYFSLNEAAGQGGTAGDSAVGGAVACFSGSCVFERSGFELNLASGGAGGTSRGGSANGGAIAAGVASSMTLRVVNCSFIDNESNGGTGSSEGVGVGGAISVGGAASQALVVNSSFSGNVRSTLGGSATPDSVARTAGAVTLRNSILSGGCTGTVTSAGFNLFVSGAVATSCGAVGADLAPADPAFGASANGVLPLGPSSPAIDAASCDDGAPTPITIATDQRGAGRPNGNGCDVGAFEAPRDVDLAVSQTLSSSLYVPATGGDPTIAVTVRVDNTSSTTAHAVTTLSDASNDRVFSSSTGSCAPDGLGDVVCDLGTIGAGSFVQVVITWEIAAGTTSDQTFETLVSARENDTDGTDDLASDTLTIKYCGDSSTDGGEVCDDGSTPGGCAVTCDGCATGWRDGVGTCDTCAIGYYGPTCTPCPGAPDNVCNGHGTCDGSGTTSGTGTCTCNTGFVSSGGVCNACTPGYGGANCLPCPGGALTPCNDNGTCLGSGDITAPNVTCDCDEGFSNADCSNACGDGEVIAPEVCDDQGESSTCDVDCTAPACGDGIVNALAGEACDDGTPSGGDGCAACMVEPGWTCTGPGACSRDCGTFYDFADGQGEWRATGAGDGKFTYGTASAIFGGGVVGWETGLAAPLPGDGSFNTAIWRQIAFAPAEDARETRLVVTYRMDNNQDCVAVRLSETATHSSADEVYRDCVHGDPSVDRHADILVPSDDLGETRYVFVLFIASDQAGARAGVVVTDVSVFSDADEDFDGGTITDGYDYKSLSCGDGCVDADVDGYGDATSRSPASCSQAGTDCLDEIFEAHPGRLEDCFNLIDNDCNGLAGGADPYCAEDCGNFQDDSGSSDMLIDCEDPVCDLALLTDPPIDPDRAPMCASPCLLTWNFGWGKSLVPDPAGHTVFEHDVAAGVWRTTGIAPSATNRVGRIQLEVPFGDMFDMGPAPTVEVDYVLHGQSGNELAVCAEDASSPTATPCHQRPVCDAPHDAPHTACKVVATANSDGSTLRLPLAGWLPSTPYPDTVTAILLTVSFNSGSVPYATEGAIIEEIRLGSDADNDGEYEGTDLFTTDNPGTTAREDRLVCDRCWDRDFDFFGDALSPDLTTCQAFINNPAYATVPDCDDTRSTVRPDLGIETSCSDGFDNDCDGFLDALDVLDCGSEDCANGIDDNGDGNIDCGDPTCAGDELIGRLPNPACDVCYTGYDFVVGDSGGGGGWIASGRLGTAVKNDIFQVGKSTYHGTQLARSIYGWESLLDAMVGGAGSGRVRAWLQRSVNVPTTMSEPALEIVYHFDGDADHDHAWGVCFNVPSATACALSQPANVAWSTTTDTVPTGASTAPVIDDETGVATFNDRYFDHVVIPFPKTGTNTVYLFFDSQGATDAENNAVRGLFIDRILVRSDADFDAGTGAPSASVGYENFDASCDHCVDRDEDGYGDADVIGADLSVCDNPEADCDDNDDFTNPGVNFIEGQTPSEKVPVDYCYRPGDSPIDKDNNCDGKSDGEDSSCAVCGNGIIDFGETCDDGPNDFNPVSGDGCTGNNDPAGRQPCQIETGGLYITEIHLPILFGNPAEQWIEIYNATNTTYDLASLGFELVVGPCDFDPASHLPTDLESCRRLKFTGDDAVCTYQTTATIGPNEYYVVNFGPIASSGFANPSIDIDASCVAPVSLSQIGDTISFLLDSGGGPEIADQVAFVNPPPPDPQPWSCALTNFRTSNGRSFMLADPPNHNQGSNDTAANWCLAGPSLDNRYANTDRHFGSPGAPGSCGEFNCDGINDDCHCVGEGADRVCVDEIDGTYLVDPDGDEVCSQLDAQGHYVGVDCKPLVKSCGLGPTCTSDVDGDGYVDCLDGCEDIDNDGYGRTVTVDGPACSLPLIEGVVQPSCVTPGCNAIDGRTGAEQVCEGIAQSFPGNPEICDDAYDNDCDGVSNCLDTDCVNTEGCKGETCASQVETISCGGSVTAIPRSADFPTCTSGGANGNDKVYRFQPLQAGPVSFIVENLGSRRYELQVYSDTCAQSSCGVASATSGSFCIGGGQVTIPDADPASTYYVVVKQIGACTNGASPAAKLTASCPEICNGNGLDEDANGKTDCDDTTCVQIDAATPPAPLCAALDYDGDGVTNQAEYTCGTNRLIGTESIGDDRFKDPDMDNQLNCVDTDDDNDGASDAQETTSCLNPLSKNNPAHYPMASPACTGGVNGPACSGAAPLACEEPGVDADCNSLADRTEAACGTKEAACGNHVDDDGDGRVDCADDDCIPDPLCCEYDWDSDNALNCTELACNTNPRDASSVPTPLQAGDHDGDTIPNCSDPDDDDDTFSDVEETLCGSDPYDDQSVPDDNDGDRQCDPVDPDDDNDDFPDLQELSCMSDPFDPASTPLDDAHDLDHDAICDANDDDIDGDGWLNFEEISCETDPRDAASNPTAMGADVDDDHLCDRIDTDDDGDGWPDSDENACQTDKNDPNDVPADCDEDRECDFIDTDDDGDGSPDTIEQLCGTGVCDALSKPLEIDTVDTDGDTLENCIDPDDDNDDIPDAVETAGCPAPVPAPLEGPNCTDPYKKDTDKDGLEDGVEDANHDGMTNGEETSPVRIDTDGDGLSDAIEAASCYPTEVENECAPSEGWNKDTDGDDILDGFEDANHDGSLGVNETNPLIADTDGDGFDDGNERDCLTDPLSTLSYPLDLNENGTCDGAEKDTDEDGISDALEEYCGTDPLDNASTPSLGDLQDTDEDETINCRDVDDDEDGFADIDEIDCGTDPRDDTEAPTLDGISDYDGDGIKNCVDLDDDDDGIDDIVEVNELGTDPQDWDSDDDGLSDGQEDKLGTDPNNVDSDFDGVQDGTEYGLIELDRHDDTDPDVFVPDADPTTKTGPKNPDTDGDGLKDGEEDANGNGNVDEGEGDPLDPTDGLRDTDADGLIDRDERFVWNTDPFDKDTDHDGLDDKLEVLVHDTDPNVPDTDGGGIIDGFEVENGTDPKLAEDDFTGAVISGDNVFGCTSGGSGEAAMLFITILGGILMVLRRKSSALGAVLLTAGLAATGASPAHAQATPSGNIEQFVPGGGGDRVWSVETSAVAPAWTPYASFLFFGERNSLILTAGRHEEELIGNQQVANLQLGIGLADYLQFDIGLPFVVGMESGGTTSINPLSGGGMMDMLIRLRGRIINNRLGGFGLGLTAGVTVPTGDDDHFRGDPGVGILTALIADYRTGGTVLSLNLGARIRTTEAEFLATGGSGGMTLGNELNYGLGVDIEVAAQVLSIGVELFGKTPFDEPFGSVETTSLEALFGPKWAFVRGLQLQAAAGIGLVQGRGTPDFRFLFGLSWQPGDDDADADGVMDADDNCPRDPEDIDGFADFDGCPDPDNDNDGILDIKDKCPNKPENFDGIDDEDGCPEAETFADKDLDGIPDDRDQCPEIPETVNGYEDGDGCKDVLPPGWGRPTGPSVAKDPDCIVGIEDLIVHFEFGSAELTAEAKKVLFDVANKLNNNAYVKFVSVNGHADEQGDEVANLKLSQARARAVKAYLTEQVVDRDKMAARGYGAFAPKVDQSNPEAYAENRRVDFTVELGGKCAGQ